MKSYLNKETHRTPELGKSLVFLLFVLISSVFSAASAAPVVTYIHTDTLGSPIAATNSSGELVWRESYKPFGERLEKSSQAGARKPWYTGHVQDQDTGLVYMGARYYDPQVGRFMSTDPVGFLDDKPMQFNRYAYANNNPYTYVDPDGEIAAHVGKFFLDFSLNLAINYVESGQLNVMDAAIDSASNLMNPAASVKKISRVAQIVQGSKKVTKSTVQANKAAGDAARDAIAARTGGVIEQNFRVTGGLRRVDVVDGTTAIESKVGRTGLTKRVRQELARDVKMLRSGQVDRVQWEFSRSGVTGKSGPTGPLRQKLEKFGIDIVE